MVDQCVHCTLRGNMMDCEREDCTVHESWYATQLKVDLTECEKDLRNIYKDTGGHFCPDWDYLFITPNSKEWECCVCHVPRVGARVTESGQVVDTKQEKD